MYIGRIKAIGKKFIFKIRKYNREIILVVNKYININYIDAKFPGIGAFY